MSPPTAVLSELIDDVTVLIDPLMTVLKLVSPLARDDIAPLNELLMMDSDVL